MVSTLTPEMAQPQGRPNLLYRRLWRWHFYAAFLVIPFVILQSITGTLYLWQDSWADWAHPQLRFVQPQAARQSADAQLAAARAQYPHAQPTLMQLADHPRRSTQIFFRAANAAPAGLEFPVFVDPYTAQVLGSVSAWSWMPGWTRKVHGGWPLGKPGSWLLELGACWAVVMILTGLYLWWPRDRSFLRATFPRFGEGRRTLILDLHACVAMWCSVVVLVFLVTALPWTDFWGQKVLVPLQNAAGQVSPFMKALRARSVPVEGAVPMRIEDAVLQARARGLQGTLDVSLLGRADSALWLRNRMPRASQEHALAFDRYSHQLVEHTRWQDYPMIPRAVAVGVDLHEGSYFGRANRWLNTAVSAALLWTVGTGFVSWWMRRPQGRLGAPVRSQIRLPRGLIAAALVLCLLLPMLGLSVLALWALYFFRPLSRRLMA